MQPPLTPQEKQNAFYVHISSFAGLVVPLGNIIAPLIIWQSHKDKSAFVHENGKQVLNFQIFISIFYILAIIAHFWLTFQVFFKNFRDMKPGSPEVIFDQMGWFFVPSICMFLLWIFNAIFTVRGALKAQKGQAYRYPISIPLIN